MARQANFFALLDGVDGDEEMAALVDRLAGKVEADSVRLPAEETKKKEQLPQRQTPSARSGFQSSYDARQQGRGLQGRGSMRNVGSNGEFIEYNQSNGYQHNHGPNDGRARRDMNIHQANCRRNTGSQEEDYSGNGGDWHQATYKRNGGYMGNYGRGDGHEGKYRQFNGYGRCRGRPDHRMNKGGDYRQNDDYQGEDRHGDSYGAANRRNYNGDFANGNRLEQGLDRGGSERGPNQEQGYWRKSQVVMANEQLESDKHVMDSEINHEKVLDGQSNEEMRQTSNGNRILSGHEGEQDLADGVLRSTETKEVNANDNGVNSDGNTVASSDGQSVNEVSKDVKVKQKKSLVNRNTRKSWKEMTDEEKKAEQKRRAEERDKEIEEDKKLFTLEQYEEILVEKKKALLAVSKTVERHVAVDKDFDTMQPIVKKKEDVMFIKAHSEKDQMVKKDIIKGEKSNKLKNAGEFFQASGRRKCEKRDDQFSRRAAFVNVKIDDQSQFPVLGRSAK